MKIKEKEKKMFAFKEKTAAGYPATAKTKMPFCIGSKELSFLLPIQRWHCSL